MKKFICILLIVFGIFVLLFCFWFFDLSNERERRLMKEGDVLIEKIEKFRTKHGKLPDSFQEMGIEETGLLGGCCGEGADLLYYDKEDSLHYIVYFGTTLGEGIYYFSDTQQWEDRMRGIGNGEEMERENEGCIAQKQMVSTEQEALNFFVKHLVDDNFFKNVNVVIDENLQDFPLNNWIFSDLSTCETCNSLNPISFVILEKIIICYIPLNYNRLCKYRCKINKANSAGNPNKMAQIFVQRNKQ